MVYTDGACLYELTNLQNLIGVWLYRIIVNIILPHFIIENDIRTDQVSSETIYKHMLQYCIL